MWLATDDKPHCSVIPLTKRAADGLLQVQVHYAGGNAVLTVTRRGDTCEIIDHGECHLRALSLRLVE